MSNKKKILLSVILLCISAAIFGYYAIGNAAGLSKVKGSEKDDAIDFARSVIQAVQDGNPRDFIARSLNPGERGLKECYDSLRGIVLAPDPEWKVKKTTEDTIYHVFFKTDGGRIVMMLKYVDNQWKFAYVTQG